MLVFILDGLQGIRLTRSSRGRLSDNSPDFSAVDETDSYYR